MASDRHAGLPAAKGGGWPYRFALLTCVFTVVLILAGGLVTSTGSGLAVPDWPTTFGYNMFLFPWSKMVGGVFIEHSHRLLGSLVGILTILTAAAIWKTDERKWMRRLGAAAVGLVILQGVLGGMRVVLIKLNLAIVHACVAQIFFGLMVSMALFTSRGWHEDAGEAQDKRLARLSLITVFLLYVQIIFGAVLRHTGNRLDAHLLFAALSSIHVILLAWKTLKLPNPGALAKEANCLWILLLVQLALGGASWLGKYAAVGEAFSPGLIIAVTSAHVLVGAMLFAASLVVALRLNKGGPLALKVTETPVAAGGARA
jgi:cytochrome c oxidase assembly protein subunit 15